MPNSQVILICLGHELRGDDSAALIVLQRLKKKHPELFSYYHHSGDITSLMEVWKNKAVLIVDAVDSRQYEVGTILFLDPYNDPSITWDTKASSSHALSLDTALKLSSEFDCKPSSIGIYGIVGKDFSIGQTPSPEVRNACIELENILIDKS